MRLSLLPVVALLALTLPVVSGCSKKEAPPVPVELKSMTSIENGISLDMPEPHKEKVVDAGRMFYWNCPDGTYKLFISTKEMANLNPNPKAREQRDSKAVDSLKNHIGSYIDTLAADSTIKNKLNFKYEMFDEKGTTGSIGGGADGRRHLIIKHADNDVTLKENTSTGEYRARGYVGENAVYLTAVEGKPEFVNTPEATQFLESFKIIGPVTAPIGAQ